MGGLKIFWRYFPAFLPESGQLLGRANKDLIDGHMARSRYNVYYGIRDVSRVELLNVPDPLRPQFLDFRPHMRAQFCHNSSGFDNCYTHMPARDLLPQ